MFLGVDLVVPGADAPLGAVAGVRAAALARGGVENVFLGWIPSVTTKDSVVDRPGGSAAVAGISDGIGSVLMPA